MLKKNKYKIIVTTLVTLLPVLIGVEFWHQLPEKMATHFGVDGTPDGWSSKAFVVFGLPAILTILHLLCAFVISADPKHKNINDTMFSLSLWIVPVVSLFVTTMTYAYALGVTLDINIWTSALIGVLFIILGSFLPKCRQNYTIGIKVPWTLADEENWDKTHRLAGWVWMLCGVAFFFNIMAKSSGYLIVVMLLAVIIPTAYSFVTYLKKRK